MVLGLIRIILVAILLILSCGEYGYSPYYSGKTYTGSTRYGQTCESVCEDHCGVCFSWASDQMKCDNICESKCRTFGCTLYRTSVKCDDIFESLCAGEFVW